MEIDLGELDPDESEFYDEYLIHDRLDILREIYKNPEWKVPKVTVLEPIRTRKKCEYLR